METKDMAEAGESLQSCRFVRPHLMTVADVTKNIEAI